MYKVLLRELRLLQKLGSEYYATSIYPAVHFSGIVGELYLLHYRAALEGGRGSSYFQVFNKRYGVSIIKNIAVTVFYFHVSVNK